MPTDANEDDKIDETNLQDEKGDIKTDAPDYQKDENDDSDRKSEIRCRSRAPHCTGNWVRTFYRLLFENHMT